MTKLSLARGAPLFALVLALAGTAVPVHAQDSAEARLRRLEAEVRSIKRQVDPDGARTVAPQAMPITSSQVPGAPATTPMADMLIRVDALEGRIAQLTAQYEEANHKLRQLETRVAAAEAALAPPAPPSDEAIEPSDISGSGNAKATPAVIADRSASSSNLSAMTGSSASVKPASAAARSGSAAGSAAAPSPERLAAVRAVAKPQTDDPGDDEYSYGFRLWDAKLYPEAGQQLKLFLDKYPRHARVSWARNLMGRALLDDGKPREAATWFLQNYQADKRGARAPDSLLFLAEAMTRLKDTKRACIALAEFAETYPAEAAGRLRAQYDAAHKGVKCN